MHPARLASPLTVANRRRALELSPPCRSALFKTTDPLYSSSHEPRPLCGNPDGEARRLHTRAMPTRPRSLNPSPHGGALQPPRFQSQSRRHILRTLQDAASPSSTTSLCGGCAAGQRDFRDPRRLSNRKLGPPPSRRLSNPVNQVANEPGPVLRAAFALPWLRLGPSAHRQARRHAIGFWVVAVQQRRMTA
jgi:hypothetical protein